jgi:hypothetical protein
MVRLLGLELGSKESRNENSHTQNNRVN